MKVIQLTNRTIFVDDIISIYKENKSGEFQNYTDYYIETKYQRIPVNESDYKKVQYYLLSLNEPIYEEISKEDKKTPEKLNLVSDGDTITLFGKEDDEWTILDNVDVIVCNKINSIIDYLKSKGE